VSDETARARLRELSDFAAPWSIWIAATLRLADHIEAGATRADELAAAAGADAGTLRRLLAYLVGRGVLTESGGVYGNTELSLLLREEAGWRQWLDLDGAPGIWAESYTRLLHAVLTGSPGHDEPWYYEELARKGLGSSFDALMVVQVTANADALVSAYDWSAVGHVVDVGGGTGHLLRTLLAAHPHLRGTLYDLPQVVAGAEPAERLQIVAGDVLEAEPPAADVYILSQVLHGWRDPQAETILARCRKAGGEGSRILVVEGVLTEPPRADEAAFDLFMLTLTGGRQRSLEDFRRLAASAGLELRASEALPTGSSLVELRS
jgi:2,7-dihydroxy-5-methyl-1-naphthoate 7-O-methyltransferase